MFYKIIPKNTWQLTKMKRQTQTRIKSLQNMYLVKAIFPNYKELLKLNDEKTNYQIKKSETI